MANEVSHHTPAICDGGTRYCNHLPHWPVPFWMAWRTPKRPKAANHQPANAGGGIKPRVSPRTRGCGHPRHHQPPNGCDGTDARGCDVFRRPHSGGNGRWRPALPQGSRTVPTGSQTHPWLYAVAPYRGLMMCVGPHVPGSKTHPGLHSVAPCRGLDERAGRGFETLISHV